MATVSVQRSPQVPTAMASRRVPLANNPNAANSPYRPSTAGIKRARADTDQKDGGFPSQPPSKRAALDLEEAPSRRNPPPRRPTTSQNSLQSRLEAARDSKPQRSTSEKPQKLIGENLETIRQWQRHYRGVFPKYVFYFESVPEEQRKSCSKQIQTLGAVSSASNCEPVGRH
jgi:regulatory subunit for Cdc7p protein kinase